MASVFTKFVIVFLVFDSTQSAIVFQLGGCPAVNTVSVFNQASYLGQWFEYERFNNWFERGLECGYAFYGNNQDGSIKVMNSGTNKRTGEENLVEGRATIPDAAKPGELKVSFSQFDFTQGANYFLMGTDYTSYALVYSCTNVPFLPITLQIAWILTRGRGVEPSNIANIKATLESYGIPTTRLNRINQQSCSN